MGISLYTATVESYLQGLGGVAGFLERGFSHFADNNIDPNSILEMQIIDDMLPFKYQIWAVTHHSLGAIEAVKKGSFSPPPPVPAIDYAGLQKLVGETQEKIKAIQPSEIEALLGSEVNFEIAGRKFPYTAEDFFLSFSKPNFYFHAATAYGMLRAKGVPIGKRDYMGRVRMKK